MTISEILKKMIEFSDGNLHDINHLQKVHSYAKLIGESENISTDDQAILEIAAIVHDIACPLCREKYGNTNGKYQEEEGIPLTKEFLSNTGLKQDQIERIAFLVGHHHSPQAVDGIDFQILLEADYLVNADESCYSKENIRNTMEQMFKTQTGKYLLEKIYLI